MTEAINSPDIVDLARSHPILKNGRYRNPWDDWKSPNIISCRLLAFICTKKIPRIPRPSWSEKLWDALPIYPMRLRRERDLYFYFTLTPLKLSYTPFRFGNNLRWYVPMGLKSFFNLFGIINVVELTWWQECTHDEETKVKVVCTPSYHWTKRKLFDNNKVLWCSWCVVGPKCNFYFAGDTGSFPAFKEIGQEYGPFTLATIPIGAYEPRWLLFHQHVNPEEAVDIHKDVKANISVAIHWGTFPLGYEFYLEPREKLKEALEMKGVSPSSFFTVNHGEIIIVNQQ
ncbi:unnamed protein product [Candidula unifasciata]|uniref:Metallo-beta-lactamase domain-containing protein n=1 Tax=Candidula unifasciata TaxID=100452 RepID=A0A8S3YZ23_9EUPU|nr:unnamed protein product [Candidula unifasciata]